MVRLETMVMTITTTRMDTMWTDQIKDWDCKDCQRSGGGVEQVHVHLEKSSQAEGIKEPFWNRQRGLLTPSPSSMHHHRHLIVVQLRHHQAKLFLWVKAWELLAHLGFKVIPIDSLEPPPPPQPPTNPPTHLPAQTLHKTGCRRPGGDSRSPLVESVLWHFKLFLYPHFHQNFHWLHLNIWVELPSCGNLAATGGVNLVPIFVDQMVSHLHLGMILTMMVSHLHLNIVIIASMFIITY